MRTAAKTLLTLSVALLALAFVSLAPGAPPERDDALDDLLKKVEEKESAAAKPPAKPGKGESKSEGDASKPKPSGELAPRDKDIDGLLEKLGASDDKPSPDERKPQSGRRPGEPDKDQNKDQSKDDAKPADALKGKDKDIDEHLKEASGKRRKKKQQEGEGDGPLGQVIKEMREVEERLGKPDTGEETRKKEQEIVKKLETLIEQARNSQQQTMVRKKRQGKAQGKPQPGQNPGEQAGTTGGQAPFTKPQNRTDRRSLAGGKELWGDLPPEVRQDLDNVMKEGFLPSYEEQIRRYYLSLSKKKTTRGSE